ncbi:MAG: hypothetical protein JWL63_2844 [Rhodocyclales bacterium]|nr:hypothetical protein [Rhodocyclales bacterium]
MISYLRLPPHWRSVSLRRSRRQRVTGLTLIEMIVSLVLVGLLSSIVAVFLQVPLQSYFVTRQRLDLVDGIELSMRHMDQELRQALPNSVRSTVVGGVTYIEFLATRGSGRYRALAGGPAGACPGGNDLNTAANDNCFTTIGPLNTSSAIRPGFDYVVLGQSVPVADAYSGGTGDTPNKSLITAFTLALGTAPRVESRLRMNNATLAGVPSELVYIVSGPVTYACSGTAGQLIRYSGYPITALQATPPVGATQSVIAANLLVCNARYLEARNVLAQGIVSVDITLSNNVPGQPAEAVNFVVHAPVSKTP